MEVCLQIDDSDVAHLREAYERIFAHELIQERIRLNVGTPTAAPTRDSIWCWMTLALATSQQRSAPGTRMWDLWCADPCPLRLEIIESWHPKISREVAAFLKDWGGIRTYHRIAGFVEYNYRTLFEDGVAPDLNQLIGDLWALRRRPSDWDDNVRYAERAICGRILELRLKGIGPKQCRNWLLNAHLLRYETPLDSRVLKFLKRIAPRVPLDPDLLASPVYYHFVEDIV